MPFVDGRWLETGDIAEVRSPGSGEVVARVHRARPADVEDAIRAAVRAFGATRAMPTWERTTILTGMAQGLRRRHEDLVVMLAREAGKPLKAGRAEVDRAIFTCEVAAEEARRIPGELFTMDWAPWGADHLGIVRRFPIGPVAGIVPFNFPLNLCVHKVAPAIAAGNTMVLKPASQTPSTALALAEIASESGLPAGALNVLPAAATTIEPLVTDERIRLLSFTGSAAVGWDLKRRAHGKRVTLELGGNAAAIVHHDADLDRAADRITVGGYSYAGQSCISVQRALVHRRVHDRFLDALVSRVKALRVGDPMDERTDVGPMITEPDAERAAAWIREAVEGGAKLACGGSREGAYLMPAVVAGVRADMRISCQEVFAPVVAVTAYDTLDEAIGMANDSPYGLQAGIFTRDAPSVWKAFHELEVGGVMVDDVPTFRVDHMPYGGVKQSGVGREGLRYAIEEMTEIKVMGWHVAKEAR